MITAVAALACWIALSAYSWIELPFSWLGLLSTALTVTVLTGAARASRTSGWPLFGLLLSLYAGIGVINIQLESLVFRIGTRNEIAWWTFNGLTISIAVSAAIAWAITRDGVERVAPAAPVEHLWLRLPVFSLSYVVLYLAAGASILPFVRDFYDAGTLATIPPFGLIVGTQIVRGLIYAAAVIPFLRHMTGRKLQGAVTAGLALAVLGGLAPLLLPVDDVFPMAVRKFHMLEIFGSNFLLGVIAAALFVPSRAGAAHAAV